MITVDKILKTTNHCVALPSLGHLGATHSLLRPRLSRKPLGVKAHNTIQSTG